MKTAICLHNATVLTGFSIMHNCAVYIKNNQIADVYNEERFNQKVFAPKVKIIDVKGAYVMPGFIDTHIHGIGGKGADDADYKSILHMSKVLPQYGVTSFIPTCCTAKEAELIKKITAIVKACGKEKGANILGIHLEGPFLSPERIGAQSADGISPVSLPLMHRLYKASKNKLINMTVAPELKGMRELALYCNEKGIILQAGHTNATYEQMLEGMQANIMHVTHLFNAMRPMHHREPGVVGSVLIHPEVSCEIIGDGVHINPHLIDLLLKSKPLSQIVLITDALYPAKTDLSQSPELYLNKCFYRKEDNVINGSAISMLDGFRNLISWGVPIEKAVRMASTNPAQIMKQKNKGLLIPGYDADVIVLDKDLNLMHTIINGQFIEGIQ
ncbi:MAG: N-acetylglucosamine-6-phosphate deacetylase [Alphaproteobacteria bacterium]|nr:N-acetylglucosamine-6-phosphate deacetylase [Alphaproteobacteria bacterium]